MFNHRSAAALAAVMLVAPAALAGPDWIERGDAGSLLGNAQQVVGVNGPIRSIAGSLSFGSGFAGDPPAPDLEDMYLLRITSPTSFLFTAASTDFNPRIYVFNVTLAGEAFGLLANDDSGMGTGAIINQSSTDLTGAMINQPGIYAIAICGLNRAPVSSRGEIYNLAVPTEVSGPDGPGGLLPHSGWTGEGQGGSYHIQLVGTDWYDVPSPGSGALAFTAFALLGRGRRR